MSCSIIALPVALAWIVGSGLVSLVTNKSNDESVNKVLEQIHNPNVDNLIGFKQTSNLNMTCDDVHVFNEETLLSKSFETPFNDKEILIKTLEEHGVNITENSDLKIVGKIDKYILDFEKNDAGKPYYLTARYDDEKVLNTTLEDLNSEYAVNIQENTYLGLIEKLKENNMEIEEEEVLEDNTIVLTVNLE